MNEERKLKIHKETGVSVSLAGFNASLVGHFVFNFTELEH